MLLSGHQGNGHGLGHGLAIGDGLANGLYVLLVVRVSADGCIQATCQHTPQLAARLNDVVDVADVVHGHQARRGLRNLQTQSWNRTRTCTSYSKTTHSKSRCFLY